MTSVLEQIQDHYAELTPSERKIAAWLDQSISKLAFLTVSQLAKEISVSEATIIRFTRKIGYGSYPSLQRDVQENIQKNFSLGDKFTRSLSSIDSSTPLERAYRLQLENLHETFQSIDAAEFDAVVEAVSTARHVGVVGFRASAGVATYLAFALNLVRPGVSQIELSLDNVHEQLLDYTEDDVLISFSLSRPAKKTIEVVSEARTSCGMKVVAITNGRFSPIAGLANHLMIAATHGTFNSYTAIMAICHALVEGTATRLSDSAEARLRTLDAANAKDVYYSEN